jgi:hypothetical protein
VPACRGDPASQPPRSLPGADAGPVVTRAAVPSLTEPRGPPGAPFATPCQPGRCGGDKSCLAVAGRPTVATRQAHCVAGRGRGATRVALPSSSALRLAPRAFELRPRPRRLARARGAGGRKGDAGESEPLRRRRDAAAASVADPPSSHAFKSPGADTDSDRSHGSESCLQVQLDLKFIVGPHPSRQWTF